jgi:nucleotide-binding universal stress UspA family protein
MSTGVWAPTLARVERKIIVGYEDSPQARDALALAGLLGVVSGRQLLLATYYCDDPVRYGRGDDRGELFASSDAHRILEAAPVAVDIERLVIHGRSAAIALSMLAEDQDAAAVVVGSSRHAHGGFTATGGVARELLNSSPCSVAVAPLGYQERAPERLERLLVAYINTDEGLAALRIAESLAHAAGARLRVVSVVESDSASSVGHRQHADPLSTARQHDLDQALRGLANTVDADGAVLSGDPVALVLALAAFDVDLIIGGSRGFGPARQVALGSVSSRLVELSPVPVLVVPRGGDRDIVAISASQHSST